MFKKAVSALLVVSVMSWTLGCSHTHFVTQEPVIGEYLEINKAAKGRKGEIILVSGDTFVGESIHVSFTLTSWTVPGTGTEKAVPTSDIREIVFLSHRNVGLGLGLGVLIGGTVGVAVGAYANGSSAEPRGFGLDDFRFTDEQLVIIGGVLGAVAGGIVGLVAGAKTVSKDRFVLPELAEGSSQR